MHLHVPFMCISQTSLYLQSISSNQINLQQFQNNVIIERQGTALFCHPNLNGKEQINCGEKENLNKDCKLSFWQSEIKPENMGKHWTGGAHVGLTNGN